ncbi:MAG: HAD family hydrolase [Rhodospirillales bacterium]|nr:MAG: HAD family hydrolase [Rhodospirillales bacterium]
MECPPADRRGAVFFDRDGVLNEDRGYTHRIEDLRWMPGAREAVRAVNHSGRFAFVVTNQAGVARGLYREAAILAFHDEMQRRLADIGARIDEYAYCPHHPDGIVAAFSQHCSCRKPEPGMILALLSRWPVDPQASMLIGDRDSDIAAAKAAGIAARLYRGGDLRSYIDPPEGTAQPPACLRPLQPPRRR